MQIFRHVKFSDLFKKLLPFGCIRARNIVMYFYLSFLRELNTLNSDLEAELSNEVLFCIPVEITQGVMKACQKYVRLKVF